MWMSYSYLAGDSSPMIHVTTDRLWKRESGIIAQNYSNGAVVDERCVEFIVNKERIDGSTASVNTRERWLYRWVNTSDNSYDEPVESVTYNCLYQLKHVEGEGWLVDTVDTTVVDGAAN